MSHRGLGLGNLETGGFLTPKPVWLMVSELSKVLAWMWHLETLLTRRLIYHQYSLLERLISHLKTFND